MKRCMIALLCMTALLAAFCLCAGEGDPTARIIKVFQKQKRLVLVWREYENNQPVNKVWADIYCASNGIVVLERRVNARVIPAKVFPEKIVWPVELQ